MNTLMRSCWVAKCCFAVFYGTCVLSACAASVGQKAQTVIGETIALTVKPFSCRPLSTVGGLGDAQRFIVSFAIVSPAPVSGRYIEVWASRELLAQSSFSSLKWNKQTSLVLDERSLAEDTLPEAIWKKIGKSPPAWNGGESPIPHWLENGITRRLIRLAGTLAGARKMRLTVSHDGVRETTAEIDCISLMAFNGEYRIRLVGTGDHFDAEKRQWLIDNAGQSVSILCLPFTSYEREHDVRDIMLDRIALAQLTKLEGEPKGSTEREGLSRP